MLDFFALVLITAIIVAIFPSTAFYAILFWFALVTYAALKDYSWGERICIFFFFIIFVGTCLT